MERSDTLLDVLDTAGYRLTEPRRALAGLISERAGHFTADELLTAARRKRVAVGRATVFRSLELLANLGAVERVDLPSGEHAYVSCARGSSHHHHVVCSACGRATDFADGGLTDAVEAAGRRTGYAVTSHRVELFGICPDCQARQSSSQA